MPAGRPLKQSDPSYYDKLIEDYFNKYPNSKDWTMTELAYDLDFTSRKQLIEYAERPEFRNIKKAKLKVEMSYEKIMKEKGHAGAIFALKNMNWHDKQEVEHSGETVFKVIYDDKKPSTEEKEG